MKVADAIHHFGSAAALAKALGISKAAVSQWGVLIPIGSAARLEKITEGKLSLALEHYQLGRRARSTDEREVRA